MTQVENIQLRLDYEVVSTPLPQVRRERLPTNTTTRNHAVHRWFNFIAGFFPEFVNECIEALPESRRETLLDPFTGCGTAQVEALRSGMKAIGYEPHPVFVRIARAKTAHMNALNRLHSLEETIRGGLERPCNVTTLGEKPEAFLSKLFEASTLAALLGARNAIQESSLADDDLGFLVLSKLLEKTSHSQTDGIYKAPTSKKRARDPSQVLGELMSMMRVDLTDTAVRNVNDVNIYNKTCEAMEEVGDATVDLNRVQFENHGPVRLWPEKVTAMPCP